MAKTWHLYLGQKRYLFSLRINFLILCLFFFCTFCVLGTWQLHRYDYKKALSQRFEKQSMAQPVSFLPLPNSEKELSFRHVELQGYYRNDLTFFIQNRQYKNRIGFEVLTPFQIPGEKKLLLVNRGWIKAEKNVPWPKIADVVTKQHIQGYIKLLNEYRFMLGKNILEPEKKPLIMQDINVKEISQITNLNFFPFILRLDPEAPNGFVRDWVITTSLPQRHLAYAMQWFAMAMALLIAYLFFCFERVK